MLQEQTFSQEAVASGMNAEPTMDSEHAHTYAVAYTLYDVFKKHVGKIEAVYLETLISRPTLIKYRDLDILDTVLFIRCPDGSVKQYLPKPPSKYAK